MMLRNACENLRPGGVFIGTTVDSNEIVSVGLSLSTSTHSRTHTRTHTCTHAHTHTQEETQRGGPEEGGRQLVYRQPSLLRDP